MKIPSDIHARVLELTNAIVEAGRSGDTRASWTAYDTLRNYCETLASEGRDHPFLWETLADFTGNDSVAIGLYKRALPLATANGANEYAASICLALAERHSNLDEFEQARDYAEQADTFARSSDDLPLRQEISQFLLDHATPSVE